MRICGMHTYIYFFVSPSDRRHLAALSRDRNTAEKHIWRAEIVMLSGKGIGTMEIMRRTATPKTGVWRWVKLTTKWAWPYRDKDGSTVAERASRVQALSEIARNHDSYPVTPHTAGTPPV
jgi:hypothetical protein